MRVAWPPLLLGLGLLGLGVWFLGRGWGEVVGGTIGASGVASLGAGALLAVLGSIMAVAPLLAPLLYRIYGEQAFTSRGGACPVVMKCARCGEFNFRGRPVCKGCAAHLTWDAVR